jgi:hypothetical protein
MTQTLNQQVNRDFAELLRPGKPLTVATFHVHAEYRDGTVLDTEVEVPYSKDHGTMLDAVNAALHLAPFDPNRVLCRRRKRAVR